MHRNDKKVKNAKSLAKNEQKQNITYKFKFKLIKLLKWLTLKSFHYSVTKLGIKSLKL